MSMKKVPNEITVCKVECVLMPNSEVIILGKTIGWFKDLKPYLEDVKKENTKRDKDILSKILKDKWKIHDDCIMCNEYIVAHIDPHFVITKKEQDSIAELLVNAPETLKQRNELLEALESFPSKTENQTFEQFYNCAMSWSRVDREKSIAKAEGKK